MINYQSLRYRVEPMRSEDISQVMQIEHVAFTAPWSARAYDYELHYNEMAHYFVARPQEELSRTPLHSGNGSSRKRHSFWDRFIRQELRSTVPETVSHSPVVGYGGLWLMVDESHISTIATHPDWRGRGIGELLLLAMLDRSAEIGANIVTLEVRVSNSAAQALYTKYRFEIAGRRKGYYSDNGEDAYVMSTPQITTAQFSQHILELRAALVRRLSSSESAVLKHP